MSTEENAMLDVMDALEASGIQYFLSGSFASNYYGIPRSTEDADFVIQFHGAIDASFSQRLGPDFELDPQMSFETVTGTYKQLIQRKKDAFTIELFLLSKDLHDQKRFERRQQVNHLGRQVWLPTAEDVIVTKLRWARSKDKDDVRGVIAVQAGELDWPYIEGWCKIHDSLGRLEEIRRTIPATEPTPMNDLAEPPESKYELLPKTSASGEFEGELLEVAMGPHHPSTHGVFRMDVVLDGEQVVKLKPVFGYLHRNHEKIAENTTFLASMPYTDRLDYLCSMTNNWAYALSVEKLAGLQPPERAEYIRVITAELTRLVNHTCLVGFLLQDMGALGTPLMYAFREREMILDLFESLSGSRMMCNYMRFGGCRVDLPAGWLDQARQAVAGYAPFLDEFEKLLTENEILVARSQGVGVLSAELAVNASITGPMLRASGVNYDIRKVDKYGIYDRFDFRVPLGDHGDVYDRYMIRLLEMRESIKILDQALRDIPAGPIIDPKAKLRSFKPKAGEAYGRIEGPKGELGFYLISDGTANPYRYRVRPPSLINLTVLEDMCLGLTIADAVIILGSVDIVLGEVDR